MTLGMARSPFPSFRADQVFFLSGVSFTAAAALGPLDPGAPVAIMGCAGTWATRGRAGTAERCVNFAGAFRPPFFTMATSV